MITFPVDCNSPRRKMEYLLRAQELLRKLNNFFAAWHREGKTQAQYNNLPQKIKNKYLYVPQLSKDQWQAFRNDDFQPRFDKIINARGMMKEVMKESISWNIKIEDI